ncbi:MAG: hypothetical protein JKY00_02910 [Roseicyclus sp.]|nr:hypothetical protein [Roseicyclus sp.]
MTDKKPTNSRTGSGGQPKVDTTISEKKIADALVQLELLSGTSKAVASRSRRVGVLNLETFPGKGRKR